MGTRHHLSRNLNEVKYYIKLLYFYVQNTIDGQNTVHSVSLNELKIIKKTPCQTTLVLFVVCLPLVLTQASSHFFHFPLRTTWILLSPLQFPTFHPRSLYCPALCGYSMVCNLIWRFGARNSRWERLKACPIILYLSKIIDNKNPCD